MNIVLENGKEITLRFCMFLIYQLLFLSTVYGDEDYQSVKVQDPYLELHTGPGSGYPVFYVGERGEWVKILKRKTDWFKVRLENGKEGWAHRIQMENTLTEAGVKQTFRDVLLEDYLRRRLEIGFTYGLFDGDKVLSTNIGYNFTKTFSTELSFSQVSGTFSSTSLISLNALAHPFSEWRYSPFFTIGVGNFENVPKITLVDADKTEAMAANVGIGLRFFISRRFIGRLNYTRYTVFIDDNRINEYQASALGFSFFF